LDHIRQILERRNEWDSTTVVIMGDHSWRTTQIWISSMTWTDEDQAASHGGEFDPRPAYIVKLANQRTSARIDTPFSAVKTRALFDVLMQGHIRTPADLETWARQQQ
jgi:hypothetical protein